MNNGNSKIRTLVRIRAASKFSLDKVIFCDVLRPQFLPTIVVVLHRDVLPPEDA